MLIKHLFSYKKKQMAFLKEQMTLYKNDGYNLRQIIRKATEE